MPLWSSRGVSGHQRSREIAGHLSSSSPSWDAAGGRFRLCPRRSWVAGRGSIRAATGVRNDRRARPKTVEDHDRRSCHRRPLTWRSSRVLPGPQHPAVPCAKARADLARRNQGFKIPSPPPPHTSRSERRRSGMGGALVVPGTTWGHTEATFQKAIPVPRHQLLHPYSKFRASSYAVYPTPRARLTQARDSGRHRHDGFSQRRSRRSSSTQPGTRRRPPRGHGPAPVPVRRSVAGRHATQREG